MGEVWRARDTRLERSVAIKVLPQEFAGNAQLKLRFEREAKAISQLNHPNICTLHDVGDERGTSYLVMELLEGESLADRLARGPLPLADVLRYGVQIAEGLDRAHRAGIVHRDLKPGNIMLTKSGAKLLDFGLAKASGAHVLAPIDDATVTRQKSDPRAPLTAEGTIVGTFQYMAPEQLEGEPAAARTDIFALGAVLYEMATGRRAFDGKTRTSLIAAIVSGQPPAITNVQPLAPTALDHVISTCLAKERDERWQSAHDVAQELRWIETSATAVATSQASPRRWIAAATVALLAAVAIAGMYIHERRKPRAPVSFSIYPPRGYIMGAPVISPSGDAVAFTASKDAERGVYVRPVGSIDAKKILDAPNAANLFWSPDSRWLAYFDSGRILKVPVEGGRPETICSNCVSYGSGAAWSSSGTILFTPKFAEGIYRVPAAGGEPVSVTKLDASRRETLHGWVQFAGDDDHFVYLVHTISDRRNEIYGGSLSHPSKALLVAADALVGIWKKQLLFARDGALYAQTLDVGHMKLTGEPRKVIDDVSFFEDSAGATISVAANGALLYRPTVDDEIQEEWGWYDRSGRQTEKLFEDVTIAAVALSNDDSKLAMMKFEPKKGAYDVYVYDLTRGVRTRLTSGLSNNTGPVWAPSGDRLFFGSDGDGMYDVYARADDATTPAQPIWKGGDDKGANSISPDGRTLIGDLFSAKTKNDLWVLPADGSGKPQLLVATDDDETSARFSPDGKWILYMSSTGSHRSIYVRAFPTGRSVQVAAEPGGNPAWSADGTEIYFLSEKNDQFAVPFHAAGTTPELGKPILLFHRPRMMWSWQPSHKPGRFLGMTPSSPEETVAYVNYVQGALDHIDD
jgi:Tol biopolymer transport system component